VHDGDTARVDALEVAVPSGHRSCRRPIRVLSEATVKTHVKRVMAKLHLTSRAQAVVTAYETGLVVPSASNDRSGAQPR
jgi:hypothetical protein